MKQTGLTPSSIKKIVKQLAEQHPEFASVISLYGFPPLWEREPTFQTLVHIILEQQVSLASAKSTLDKLLFVSGNLTPEKFLLYSDADLKSFGFSRQKMLYCRHLSEMILDGTLKIESLSSMPDDEVREELIKVKGIGRWSSDVYLLMVLLRHDIWPKGDLALAVGYKELFGLKETPTQNELENIAENWRPYRSVAARLIWKFYLGKRGK